FFALEDKGHLNIRDALCPRQRHLSERGIDGRGATAQIRTLLKGLRTQGLEVKWMWGSVKGATDRERGIRRAPEQTVEGHTGLRQLAEHVEALPAHIVDLNTGEIDIQLGAIASAVACVGTLRQALRQGDCLLGKGALVFQEEEAVECLFH